MAIGVLAFAGLKYYDEYEQRAAAFDLNKIGEVSQRSVVYDVDSKIYSYLHGQNRMVIPLESVSGWFIQALLAREDSRFWEHNGIDYKGVLRAAVTNFREGEVKQGASTLTQQLARNALELNAESYDRKALEAMLAWRIERTFDKKKILELYLNRIYFGSGFYGLETASRGYFNKPASELNLSESAMLAAVIRSPNGLSPRRNLEDATIERDVVLKRMVELHMIRQEDAAAAMAYKVVINHDNPLHFQEDYVMDAVHRDLAEIVQPEQIELGGLKIYMTIDPALQKAALEAADRQLTKVEEQKNYPHPRKADFEPGQDENGAEKPTDYLQAALMAVDNRTGAIRA
ncbi:MAG: transglycosylase domain-containing protein, partial [Chthoniobacteraceae bacterium]